MQTEGIKYADSKLKLLPYIIETVLNLDGVHTILDGFSGFTPVSQAFAPAGHSVISNDISGLEALKKLIDKTNARYLLLSYGSGGRLTKEQKTIDYRKNVMSSMRSTNKWVPDGEQNHYKYLFLLKKQF
jgi:adenine-specific DNA methylase